MSSRDIAEEPLFAHNAPLPTRPLPDDHPVALSSRQYVDGDQTLAPWLFWSLAPVEKSWLPLADGTECVWLVRSQKVRLALVDYRNHTVLRWRLTAGSTPYRPRPPRRR